MCSSRKAALPRLLRATLWLCLLLPVLYLLLVFGLPTVTLPAPAGPWPVGTQTLLVHDPARDDGFFGAPGTPRALALHLWYPATASATPRRTLWQELYRGPLDLFSLTGPYLSRIATHSQQDAPLAKTPEQLPVIVYSHGLALFPEQNTLLMETLASAGYLVVAVGHTRISTRVLPADNLAIHAAFRQIRTALAESTALAAATPTTPATGSRLEQAAAALVYIEQSAALNTLMTVPVADMRFVLDLLSGSGPAPAALQPFITWLDPARIGLLGMSFGGGAVTEVCKVDTRCRASVNLDGGIFGQRQRQPLQTPHLVLASPANVPFFEYQMLVSAADHYLFVVDGARHADFMDSKLVLPLLAWFGLTSTLPAQQVMTLMNTVVPGFFAATLGDAALPPPPPGIRAQRNGLSLSGP